MNVVSPDGKIANTRLVDAFVDDTSIGFMDVGSMEFDDLVQRLQEISQSWKHLLHLSGGSLNLQKCSWYIISCDWKDGCPVIWAPQESDPEVKLHQGTGTATITIKHMKLDEAPWVLVYSSPQQATFWSTSRCWKPERTHFRFDWSHLTWA